MFYNHNDLANRYIQLTGYAVKRSGKVCTYYLFALTLHFENL